jgi:hypothetical protein
MSYIQTFFQVSHLHLKHVDNLLSGCLTIRNVDTISHASCDVNHLLEGGVLKGLNGLWCSVSIVRRR